MRIFYLLNETFFHFSSSKFLVNESSSTRIQVLLSYKNVNIKFINIKSYFSKTPISNLFSTKIIFKSKDSKTHLSDAFRQVTMWRYGGYYLDLDMIVRKPLDSLPYNSVCVERYTDNYVNVAYMKIHKNSGKKLQQTVLE